MNTIWCSILLCLLSIIEPGVTFTPDITKLVIVSWNLGDSTHWSITQKGIRLAAKEYFTEKHAKKTRGLLSYINPMNYMPSAITKDGDDGPCWLDALPYNAALMEICVGNGLTDTLPSTRTRTDYHFDGERFNESNKNLLKNRDDAKKFLELGAANQARVSLGYALHTFQDFYSHSNWIELGNKEPSKGLGTTNGIEVPVAGPNNRTCKSCVLAVGECTDNLLNISHLTSGYTKNNLFGGSIPVVGDDRTQVLKPEGVGKCSHGGPFDDSAKIDATGGINKDCSDPNSSPHGLRWHKEAADMATNATTIFITAFRKEVGDTQFESLLNIDWACQSRRKRSIETRNQKIQFYPTIASHPKSMNNPRVIRDLLASSQRVLITSVNLDSSTNHFSIPVDSTLEDVVIEISGAETENRKSITITSPANVKHTFSILFDVSSTAYIHIQAPETGSWKLEAVGAVDPCKLNVFGISAWDAIFSVLVLEQTRHASGPGLRPLMPNEVLQSGMVTYARVMTPVEGVKVPRLQLQSVNGRVIKEVSSPIDITLADGITTQLFEVAVPETPFRFGVNAKDNKGFDVSRVSKTVYGSAAGGEPEDNSIREGTPKLHIESKYSVEDTHMSKTRDHHILSADQLPAVSIIGLACLIVIIMVMIVILLKAVTKRYKKRKLLLDCGNDA